MLQTVTVPKPPVHTDWQLVIPGAWNYAIETVRAQLALPNGATVFLKDSSGHGNDAQSLVSAGSGALLFGQSGLVAGDTSIAIVNHPVTITGPPGGTITSGDFWCNFWYSASAAQLAAASIEWDDAGFVNHSSLAVDVASPPPGAMRFTYTRGGGVGSVTLTQSAGTDLGPHMVTYVFHHAASSCDFYVDGVLAGTQTGFPGAGTYTPNLASISGGVAITVGYDELAWRSGATLSGAQVSNLFTQAGVSFAAYSAAVLALSPDVYYHFDDSGAGTWPLVALRITDGQHPLCDLAAPVPGTGTLTATYSWFSETFGNFNSAQGATVLGSLPNVTLPPGYTIGTNSVGLPNNAQWSNVVLQVDQTPSAGEQYPTFVYPPGAHLVYVQQREGQ